jgi:hypothetical protein
LLYLAFYVAVMWATAAMSRSATTIGTLSNAFAFSLVPIAIAYHATHYVPSMLMQLPALVPQLADPFYRGWALFPARAFSPTPLPMAFVWHAPAGRGQPAADAGPDDRLHVPRALGALAADWPASDRTRTRLA